MPLLSLLRYHFPKRQFKLLLKDTMNLKTNLLFDTPR